MADAEFCRFLAATSTHRYALTPNLFPVCGWSRTRFLPRKTILRNRVPLAGTRIRRADRAARLKMRRARLTQVNEQLRLLGEHSGIIDAWVECEMVHRLIVRRQRFKQALTLKERLLRSANESSKRAAVMPPGADRRKLLKWAQIARATAELDEWLSSSGPPR